MGARQKLNMSYITGTLVLAAAGGWLSGSWTVFVVVLVILLMVNLGTNEIRPTRRHHGHHGRD